MSDGDTEHRVTTMGDMKDVVCPETDGVPADQSFQFCPYCGDSLHARGDHSGGDGDD